MRPAALLVFLGASVTAAPLAAQDHAPPPVVSNPAGPLLDAAPPRQPPTKHGVPKTPKHKAALKADRKPASDQKPESEKAVAADNPLSLGMKWNGNNDNATQTRTQNYGGTAVGAGAAVGLNLHF